MLVFTVILGTWLLAILGAIATYYNFSLVRKERELMVRYGLLKTKQVSIPYNRVQAVRFSEGILRQPFGYGSLYVESAGQGDERQSSSCIIAPYIRADEVDHVLGEILPDLTFETHELEHPPERSQWRYVLRLVRPAVVVAGFASWLIPYGWISLLLLPLSVVLGMAQYRTAGFRIDGDKLLIRTRSIGRTTAVIKRSRVQAAEFKWNPLMHRRDLWSYNVTLASVSKNLNFGISYLGVEQQPAFRSWFIDVLAAQEAPAVPIDEDADHRVESDHIPTVPPSPDLPGEAEG